MLFISLEGLDGVGKTTITKLLAQKIANSIVVQTPSVIFKEVRKAIDDTNNHFVRFHFYASSLYFLDQTLSDKKYDIVICDRFLHSTIAYCWPYTYNIPDDIHDIFPGLRIPDYVFYLYAQQEIRKQRIDNRSRLNRISPNPGDINIEQQRIAESRYTKFAGMHHIDTNQISPEEIVKKIENMLQ